MPYTVTLEAIQYCQCTREGFTYIVQHGQFILWIWVLRISPVRLYKVENIDYNKLFGLRTGVIVFP